MPLCGRPCPPCLHVTRCRAPHGVVLGPLAGFPDVRPGCACRAAGHAGGQSADNQDVSCSVTRLQYLSAGAALRRRWLCCAGSRVQSVALGPQQCATGHGTGDGRPRQLSDQPAAGLCIPVCSMGSSRIAGHASRWQGELALLFGMQHRQHFNGFGMSPMQ